MTDVTTNSARIPAEDNPWYLLATLYDKPGQATQEPDKNRKSWNRYYASRWTDGDKSCLRRRIAACDHDDLKPFSDQELSHIHDQFALRANGRDINIPSPDQKINFSNCEFSKKINFNLYIFDEPEFIDSIFFKETCFNKSQFMKSVDFTGSKFRGNATFNGTRFFGITNFSNCVFKKRSEFKNANFSDYTDFSKTKFSDTNQFSGSEFESETKFNNVKFFSDSYFDNTSFSCFINFEKGKFSRKANFDDSIFENNANFKKVKFGGITSFSRSKFNKSTISEINFTISDGATSPDAATFRQVTFSDDTSFSDAIFSAKAIFTNAVMEAPTDFRQCSFKRSPPTFHGATLHEDTVWRGVSWPDPPARSDDAGPFSDAYECLKREMDRLKKHEDELVFFGKEMECRQVEKGWFKGLPIMLYGFISGYGGSYLKPLISLIGLFDVGVVALRHFQPTLTWGQAVGLSAVNCLSSFGFRKDLIGKTLDTLGTGALIVSATQTILGLILLFLIGLGLRNRFRMK